MNIYSKLTLLCLFLVVTSGTILLFFVNRKFEDTLRGDLLTSLGTQASESVANLDRFIYDRLNDTRVLAKNNTFQQDITPEQMTVFLQEQAALNELYYGFSYFDMNRIRVADSRNLRINQQHPNTLYWTRISTENPDVMDITNSSSIGQPVVHFASIVEDKGTGEPKGVLVSTMLIHELYSFLRNISVGDTETRELDVTLINANGLILYSNLNPYAVLADIHPQIDLIKYSGSQQTDYLEQDDILYFTASQTGFKNYSGNNWTLVISISRDDVFSPLKAIRRSLLWIVAPVLLGSILLALIVAYLFVTPIIRLSNAADQIARGNFEVDLSLKRKDEIGKLARQLDRTSQILIKRISEQKEMNQKLEDQKGEIARQKEEIEGVNMQLTDSISYARRIQRALLPDIKVIRKVVKDAMIYYQPRDIISGDFYWFERVRKGRSDYLVAACADCTGHGVPGAIMSMMGSNQLTNIVYYQNYLDPAKILARLDKAIKFELYSRDEEGSSKKDGMEIGVCVVNLEDYTLEFTGAGIPLYMVRKNELEQFRSIKEMVGGMEGEEREVEARLVKHTIEINKGDRFYMATDGFQDQFGGPDDRKLMTKKFKSLLTDYAGTALSEQKGKFETELNDWKGKGQQTDDVLVLGLEL